MYVTSVLIVALLRHRPVPPSSLERADGVLRSTVLAQGPEDTKDHRTCFRPRTPVPFAYQAQVLCVWGLDLLHLAMYAYTSTSPSCFAFAVIQFMSCALCAVVYHFAVANHADFFGQAKFPWYVAQSTLRTLV